MSFFSSQIKRINNFHKNNINTKFAALEIYLQVFEYYLNFIIVYEVKVNLLLILSSESFCKVRRINKPMDFGRATFDAVAPKLKRARAPLHLCSDATRANTAREHVAFESFAREFRAPIVQLCEKWTQAEDQPRVRGEDTGHTNCS